MSPVKLYNSRVWLTRQYVVLKKTPAQIAQAAGCTQMTVYRKLNEFGLIK